MKDVPAFAKNQRAAKIFSEPDGIFFRDIVFQRFGERSQKLHFDKDVPADPVLFRHVMDIITVDNVGVTLHLRHDLIFTHDAFQYGIEMFLYAGFVKPVAVQLFDFAVAFRDGDDFQGGCFRFSEKLTLNLINGSKTTCTYLFNGLPAGK